MSWDFCGEFLLAMNVTSRLFSSFVLAGLVSCHGFGVVRYVRADAPSGGNGLSWAGAHRTLQEAAAASSATDTIWVSRGTYTYTPETLIEWPGAVNVYGGFQGTETALSQRNPNVHVTTVTGSGRAAFTMSATSTGGYIVSGFQFRNNRTEKGCIVSEDTAPFVEDNKFIGNVATAGGSVLSSSRSGISFKRNYCFYNSIEVPAGSSDLGGTINLNFGGGFIVNNVFVGSFTKYLDPGSSPASPYTGDVRTRNANLQILNNTFIQTLSQPDTMYIAEASDCSIIFGNNIVSDPYPASTKRIKVAGGSVSSSYNLFPIGATTPVDGTVTGGFNVQANPGLVSGTYGYHLSSASPGRDSGSFSYLTTPLLDVDSLNRINGNIDRGAAEFTTRGSVVISGSWPEQPSGLFEHLVPYEIKVVEIGTGVVVSTVSIPSTATGEFSLTSAFSPGVYDFFFTTKGHMWSALRAVTVNGVVNLTGLRFNPKPGDSNGDNSVDLLDYFALSDSYNLVSEDVQFNSNVDFNFDDSVDLLDYFILSDNYNTMGDEIELYPQG